MIIFSRNPTGVSVQLAKWYQCMAVRWELDSHSMSPVPLNSYVIFDLWSAVLQPQVIPYSGLQYFSTLSLNRHDFLKKHFFHTMCVLIFPTTFLWNIFYYKKSRARINKKFKEPFFLSDFRSTWIFLTFSKNIQVPSFMKFRPCAQTDRQTWRS